MTKSDFCRRRRVQALTAAAAVVALAACQANTPPPSADANAPVSIGLLVSLSGTYKTVGTDMKQGFELYLKLHGNKLGGHQVDLHTEDEGEGGPAAVAPLDKLIKQNQVQALVGLVGGGTVATATPKAVAAKIPLIGTNARPGKQDTSWAWHTSYISTEPGVALGDYVHRNTPGDVWVICPDYQGGWDECGGFVDAYTKAGGKLANPDGKPTYTPFPATTNWAPYFAQIKAAKPAAVYTFYAGAAAVNFVRQYKDFGLAATTPLYAAGFLVEGSVLDGQADAALNIKNSLNYSPDLDNPANRTFAAEYVKAYNTLPTTFSMASWDGAAVLDKAIAALGGQPVTGENINKALATLGQIDSPRGPWQWNPTTHAPVQRWYLRQVRKDGRGLSNIVLQDLTTLGG